VILKTDNHASIGRKGLPARFDSQGGNSHCRFYAKNLGESFEQSAVAVVDIRHQTVVGEFVSAWGVN
jgi:hypothetical protein